ncbi:MAG: T9SS type A sorting domain-containing protein [Saprospiraceae bacterium]
MKSKLLRFCPNFLCSTALLFLFSPLSAQVFWSEDFNGGLPPSWTAEEVQGNGLESANWVYSTVGPVSIAPINSTSANNGWMLFDSDLNCSGAQEVRLISPRINCEDKVEVFLQFETLYKKFNDLVFLEWSTDSIQWTSIPLFEDVNNSQYGNGSFNLDENSQKIILDLSSFAAGEDSLFLSFKFLADKSTAPNFSTETGCAFSWQIDDIGIFASDPTPTSDIGIENFYAIAPNAMTPYDQQTRFGFVADIHNFGQNLHTGVKLSIAIKDAAEQIVYTDTLNYDSVPANTLIQNKLFLDDGFLPDASVGTYTGTYQIFSDSVDQNATNDTKTFQFMSTDSTYAKETGITLQGWPGNNAWAPGVPHSWAFGNYFFIKNGSTRFASKVSFGLGNPQDLEGQLLQIQIYKWDNINGDSISTSDERTLVSSTNYFVTGNEPVNQFFTVNLLNGGVAPIPLEDETAYLVMVDYSPFVPNRDMLLSMSTAYDYGGQWLRSSMIEEPRYSSCVELNNSMSFIFPGFGYQFVPAIRLHVSDYSTTSTEADLSAAHQIRLSPNPATDYLNVELNLAQQFEQMSYTIIDASGKLLQQKILQNIQNQQLRIQTQDFPAGLYYLNFSSAAGNRTLSFVVQ